MDKSVSIHEELENIRFKGFEAYSVRNLLFHISESERSTKAFTLKGSLYHFFMNWFLKEYKYEYKKNSGAKILFNITHSHKRNDTYELINSVAFLVNEFKDSFYRKKLMYKRIELIKGFRLLPFVFSWFNSMKNIQLDKTQKLLVLSVLVDLKRLEKALTKINIEKYNLLIVPYDASSTQNLVVQCFKLKGITTVTLQHGVFLAPRKVKGNLDFTGIELRNFIADYYLLWNQFSKDEALKTGISEKRLKVLGNPKYMDINFCVNPKNKIFGIVLNTRVYEQDNIDMITIANELAQKLNYKYYVRYHPASKTSEYDYLADAKYCIKKNISNTITEYSNTVEFSLISNSTVYFELINLKHKVYRYSTGSLLDKYRAIQYNSFKSIDGLLKLIDNNSYKEDEELFNYLCCDSVDIKANYKSFLGKFT